MSETDQENETPASPRVCGAANGNGGVCTALTVGGPSAGAQAKCTYPRCGCIGGPCD